MIHLSLDRFHILGKSEQVGDGGKRQEAEALRERRWWLPVIPGKCKAPFAEAWDIDVIGPGVEPGLLHGRDDGPIALTAEHRGGALDHDQAVLANVPPEQAIEGGGVQ